LLATLSACGSEPGTLAQRLGGRVRLYDALLQTLLRATAKGAAAQTHAERLASASSPPAGAATGIAFASSAAIAAVGAGQPTSAPTEGSADDPFAVFG